MQKYSIFEKCDFASALMTCIYQTGPASLRLHVHVMLFTDSAVF